MENFEEYILEQCNECLIGGKCIIYKHINTIENLLARLVNNTILNSCGDCKIKKVIDEELRSWVKVGNKTKIK